MRALSNNPGQNSALNSLENQPCVKAVRSANIHKKLKKEIEIFIKRNILPDCGKIPPNCLKAHMIKTAKKLNLNKTEIDYLKRLFKSQIGYKGYYLDDGKLKRV